MTARSLMKTGSSGLVITISQAMRNPNIRAMAISAGWDLVSPFTVIVDSGVDVADIRLLSGVAPAGVLTLINYGRIGGLGGEALAGLPGPGITCTLQVTIYNYGEIFGEGGRGGQGSTASCYYYTPDPVNYISSSGGGGGGGQGFSRTAPLTGKTIPIVAATAGSVPTYTYYTGGTFGGTQPAYVRGGQGGMGALIGQTGQTGSNSVTYGGTYVSPNATSPMTGRICRAVAGNSFITWGNLGLIIGELV